MSHPTRRMKFNPGRSEFLFLTTIECLYLKVLANRGRRFISKSIGKKQSFYQCLFHIPTHCQWLGEIIQVGGKRQDQPFFLRQICCSHARNAGRTVRVAGLSTGTADQLYLALRIAAVEEFLDHGTALPFIADDLFINFDDDRAAAGFEVLSQLAKKTQVLLRTHAPRARWRSPRVAERTSEGRSRAKAGGVKLGRTRSSRLTNSARRSEGAKTATPSGTSGAATTFSHSTIPRLPPRGS